MQLRVRHAASWLAGVVLLAGSAFAQTGNTNTAVSVAEIGTSVAAAADVSVSVPVLCYHRFGQYKANDPYFVTPEELKRQFEIIKSAGYTPITASTYLAGLTGKAALPAKPLLITIDDGYADFASVAQPIFQEFGFTATLFVYTHFINSKQGLSQAQLVALEKEGFEIGSHSWTHPKLTKPTSAEAAKGKDAFLSKELGGSFKQLQEWLGHPVVSLAYPYGLWDTSVAQAARDAGYALMFTVDQGTNAADTPREQLKRIMIIHNVSDKMFRFLLDDRPLKLTDCSLAPGSRVVGPVTEVKAVLALEQRALIEAKSWTVLKGGVKQACTYDEATGTLRVTLAKPWTHGTDALMVVARDKQKHHYKETWLATVLPAEEQTKEK